MLMLWRSLLPFFVVCNAVVFFVVADVENVDIGVVALEVYFVLVMVVVVLLFIYCV